VLQFRDASIDLPQSDVTHVDRDIACNVMSFLKVRNRKLEWLQIIRSDDLFLRVSRNFVQFMCLQEIMTG